MKQLNTRVLALVLALTLCLPLSMPALAAEAEDEDGALESTGDVLDPEQGEEVSEDPSEPAVNPDEGAPEEELQEPVIPAEPDETAPEETSVSVDGFADVPNEHIFYVAVTNCATMGITSGYSDGTFRPTNPVTRAQFCVMLSRAFYPNEVKKYDTDAYKHVWFGPNTKALSAAGVLTNTSFTYAFGDASIMDQMISRYDMAQLMTNIMAKKGFSATNAQKTEAQKKITDYKSIPSKYQEAVKNVYALGIITGYSTGNFGGSNNMNRGQGCVVIYRMMQYTPATSKPSTSTGNNTYDDGKPTETTPKPSTGTSSSSTGNTSSSTGTTGSTNTASTLANGKAITEENVLAMIQELLKKYPKGMTWTYGTARTGIASNAMLTIQREQITANGLVSSVQTACGGFTSLISDSIFGSGAAAPARKVPVNCVRPGDVIIKRDANGNHLHYAIAGSRITGIDEYGDKTSPVLTIYDGNANGKVRYNTYYAVPASYSEYNGYYVEVWTRYPSDNTSPWTGSNFASNPTTGSSSNSGSTGSNTGNTNTDSSTLTCDLCHTPITAVVWNSARTRHICNPCNRTTAGKNYISG